MPTTKELWQPLERVEIRAPRGKIDESAKEPALRLFCTSADTSWLLQIRGYETLASGTRGKKFLIAGATLDRDEMVVLRDAINAQLEAYAEFRESSEPRGEEALVATEADAAARIDAARDEAALDALVPLLDVLARDEQQAMRDRVAARRRVMRLRALDRAQTLDEIEGLWESLVDKLELADYEEARQHYERRRAVL